MPDSADQHIWTIGAAQQTRHGRQNVLVGKCVVCIQEENVITLRSGYTFVHRVIDTLVRLTDDTNVQVRYRTDDLQGPVTRGSIDHKPFEITEVLRAE